MQVTHITGLKNYELPKMWHKISKHVLILPAGVTIIPCALWRGSRLNTIHTMSFLSWGVGYQNSE